MLVGSPRPLTLPDVLAASSELPQSSTYRNLSVLEDAGVVVRVVTGDEFTRFEISPTLTGNHHHHLVCVACGDVADFELGAPLEARLERALDEAAVKSGFSAQEHRLDLVGRCARCA